MKGSDTVRRMRVSPAEYLRLDLRAHDLLRDVPLYDVSIVDLPGGGAGRSVADIRALESAAAPSRVANTIYGLRHFLGRVFGWDRVQMRPEDSLLSRLSERDRRDSEITPGTPVGSVLLLYQFTGEARSGSSARHWRHGSVRPRRRGRPARPRRNQHVAAARRPDARSGRCPAPASRSVVCGWCSARWSGCS